MTTSAQDVVATRVWDALGTVRDPELDEPITDLGFVTALNVRSGAGGQDVHVLLRLPTYFCAPNFAYLMVADAKDAVQSLPGVSSVLIELADHFAAEEINAGVVAQAGFGGTFPDQATGELTQLRLTFRRKAHMACVERASRELIQRGWQVDELVGARLSDLPETPTRDSLRRRRDELGLPAGPDAPLLVDDRGDPVPAGEVPMRLRFARSVRVSMEGNAGLCRGLLRTRYGTSEEGTR